MCAERRRSERRIRLLVDAKSDEWFVNRRKKQLRSGVDGYR